MVGHQEALVTYRSVELLVLSADGTLRRANGGAGVAFGKAQVKNEIGEVLPDQTYKYIAKCNKSQTTTTYRAESRALVHSAAGDATRLVVQAGRAARTAAAAADKGCDRTGHGIAAGDLDGLSPGGASSVLVTAPAAATFLGTKAFRAAHRISFDDDHPHDPGTRPARPGRRHDRQPVLPLRQPGTAEGRGREDPGARGQEAVGGAHAALSLA